MPFLYKSNAFIRLVRCSVAALLFFTLPVFADGPFTGVHEASGRLITGALCDTAVSLQHNQWSTLSLPCEAPAGTNIVDWFGDDITINGQPAAYGSDWRVFVYDPLLSTPSKYVDPGAGGTLAPGQGFWMIQMTGSDVTLRMPAGSQPVATELAGDTRCVSLAGCVNLPLTGASNDRVIWHLLGNAFPTGVEMDDLRVSTSSGPCDAGQGGCVSAEAEEANVLHDSFWHYNGVGYDPLTGGATIDEWVGFWAAELPAAVNNEPVLHVPALVSSAENGLFRVSDGRIIAPDGTDFVARGINIYNSTFYPNSYPTKGADAVDEIVGLFPKINMIRFAYQDDGPNNLFWSSTAVDDAFLATFVEAATSRRIVVLLEDHSTIGDFTWTQGQINAYTTFAARYKDNPYVWFGTENEPDTVNREGIVQNVRATYDAIRSTGNNNIVCILSRGGGYTEDILTYANYIQGGPVPNYPGSGPGAGGSSVTAMRNVIWDMHLYMWANPSASVAEVENTLWNGIDSEWGPFAGINVYRNGPQSADGIIPVIIGEWGLDWAGDNVLAVILKTGLAPYPVGNLAWNWSAGDPDILVSGNARTPYGDAVNAFIDAGTGVPEPTQR